MRIVAFAGEKYHGKDESIRGAIAVLGNGPRVGFLDELKAFAAKAFDLSYAQTHGDRKEVVDPRHGCTPRELMQQVGGKMREIDPDVWVRLTMAEIGRRADPVVYIGDVRHHNEARAIRAAGGTLIRVVRPGVPRNEHSNHESEIHIRDLEVDYEIVNNGTVKALHATVAAVLGVAR